MYDICIMFPFLKSESSYEKVDEPKVPVTEVMEREENVSDKTVPVEINPIDYDSEDEELVAITEALEQEEIVVDNVKEVLETDQIEVKEEPSSSSFVEALCAVISRCLRKN